MEEIKKDIAGEGKAVTEAIPAEAAETPPAAVKKNWSIPISIVISAVILSATWIYTSGQKNNAPAGSFQASAAATLREEKVLPSKGITLPAVWGDLGARMVKAGVIDGEAFQSLYEERGELDAEMKKMLLGDGNGKIRMTEENSGVILNLLWALGLGNKNKILEEGPMSDPRYGGAGNFASTGGWTIANGNPMNHYSKYPLVVLTADQQELVERVSQNIYRPCCNNSVYFPDCNHGMAMLGLLELMASQGVGEEEMYKVALKVNSYWFPDTYLAIAEYLEGQGIIWEKADPKEILGMKYSSASGYREVLKNIQPQEQRGGSGCGVEAPASQPKRSSGSCGV